MRRSQTLLAGRIGVLALGSAFLFSSLAVAAPAGQESQRVERGPGKSDLGKSDLGHRDDQPATARADGRSQFDLIDLQAASRQAGSLLRLGMAWYRQTPPGERMCWGGMLACAVLALAVILERLATLRRRKIVPAEFTARFLDRLHEGKLDGGKALDYCEMNPSPAARIALAAVRRWGRPAVDVERAVALAHRVEAERLRRNVGTLRRIAALAPLLGLLGSLLAVERVLAAIPASGWGPGLASALVPLTLAVAIATLALVAYDTLTIRIERLAGALDRLGAETIDAIAMAAPPAPRPLLAASPASRAAQPHSGHASRPESPIPPPHQGHSSGRRKSGGGGQHTTRDHDHDHGY